MSRTAPDGLQNRGADANVAPSGGLVSEGLKAEGGDTIPTLCGDIIDIHDGCVTHNG